MQPRIGTAVLVERCLEVLRANRVIIVVLDVVLAGPPHCCRRRFDGLAGCADKVPQRQMLPDIASTIC